MVSTPDALISPLRIRWPRCAAHRLSHARRSEPDSACARGPESELQVGYANAAQHAVLLVVQVSRRPVARSARSPMVVRASQETSRRGALSALAGGELLRACLCFSARKAITHASLPQLVKCRLPGRCPLRLLRRVLHGCAFAQLSQPLRWHCSLCCSAGPQRRRRSTGQGGHPHPRLHRRCVFCST